MHGMGFGGSIGSIGGPRERARMTRNRREGEYREAFRQQKMIPGLGLYGPVGTHVGPLPDTNWDAWFQSLEDAGVDNMADTSVGMRGGNRRGRATMSPSIYALLNELQGRSF